MRAESVRRCLSGSSPHAATLPPSGAKSPTTVLRVVVFPAPSGPMRPNISPRATSNEIPSTATTPPAYDLRRPATRTAGSALPSISEMRFGGHARLEQSVRVVETDLDAIDELHALVARLNVFRRDL